LNTSTFAPKIQALLAAILFGASAPLAKLLLADIDPVAMAALLYLGCGLGLLVVKLIQNWIMRSPSREAGLSVKDLPWLIGAIICGGVAAPIVLMYSLMSTPAATASLLLNFEGVATSVIAALAFREALGKRVWYAVALIAMASIILTWNSEGAWGFSIGAAGVILACILWGMDNNFTRNISAKDPLSIVLVKGIAAGIVSTWIAILVGASVPNWSVALAAMLLGFISYGISIMLFILALRSLGAARTSAFFGSAPFAGAIISLALFQEWPGTAFIISLPIMIAGTVLILWEEHGHVHRHAYVEHEHRHSHQDGHHTHTHDQDDAISHSHWHVHDETQHDHSHTPDIHHRHSH